MGVMSELRRSLQFTLKMALRSNTGFSGGIHLLQDLNLFRISKM